MNNRRAITVAALVVVAIGFIVVFTLRAFAPEREPAAASAANVEPAPANPAAAPAELATPAPAGEPPPWLQPAPAATGPTSTPDADPSLREQQLRELQASMRGVIAAATARSAETHQHLRHALDTLEEMNDPAVTSQINLDAVRDNLETSIRMQQLAQQLQQVAASPNGPERQQQMDAIVAELSRLQSQLHADVRAPGSTLPLPAATLPVR